MLPNSGLNLGFVLVDDVVESCAQRAHLLTGVIERASQSIGAQNLRTQGSFRATLCELLEQALDALVGAGG